jgi:hypothetical protein
MDVKHKHGFGGNYEHPFLASRKEVTAVLLNTGGIGSFHWNDVGRQTKERL